MNLTKEIQQAVCKMQVLKNHAVCENINLFFRWEMDVLSISKSDMVCEFEVKISRSDFKADFKKLKKQHYELAERVFTHVPNYFSYVCPKDMIGLSEIPKYSGLYYYEDGVITEVKKPSVIHKNKHERQPIEAKVLRLTNERMYLGVARLTYENNLIRERNKRWDSQQNNSLFGQ